MRLWTGLTVSELGSQISTVAYPLLVLALTGSPAKAGVTGFAKVLPLALLALPAGVLADRVDRKQLMIACNVARGVALASIPLALALGRPTFAQIVVVAFIDGAAFIIFHITERGALRQIVSAEQLQEAVGRNEARWFAASVAGPPLGGVLFAAGRFLPFLVDAVSYLASTAALLSMRTPFQEPRRVQRRLARAELFEGLRWLWRSRFFRAAGIMFAAGNPLFTGLYLLAILLAKRDGASSAQVGVMFAIIGVGGLLGAALAGPLRRRMTPGGALLVAEWLIAAPLPLLLVLHAAPLIGLIVAATEFLTPVANTIVVGRRIELAPDELQGRVQAAASVMTMSLGWVGPLAVGFAFQQTGATTTILGVMAYAVVSAIVATLSRSLRAVPERAEANEPALEAVS